VARRVQTSVPVSRLLPGVGRLMSRESISAHRLASRAGWDVRAWTSAWMRLAWASRTPPGAPVAPLRYAAARVCSCVLVLKAVGGVRGGGSSRCSVRLLSAFGLAG